MSKSLHFWLLKNKLNLFYALALIPLILIAFYHITWPFYLVIPIYGFLLLLSKKPNLASYHKANRFQKTLGIALIFGSFFTYYAVSPLFPDIAFYSAANNVVYILGLFLIFFETSALRESFTPLFLIVAATSSGLISEWLKSYFGWYIPQLVHFIAFVLKGLGMKVTIENPDVIVIYPSGQPLALQFLWVCIGITSLLIFSIILVIILFEEPCKLKTKLLWSIVGLIGTFFLNVARIILIFITDYYYGAEAGGFIHYTIDYFLFIAWLTLFLYAFSKRQIISNKMHSIRQKLFGRL